MSLLDLFPFICRNIYKKEMHTPYTVNRLQEENTQKSVTKSTKVGEVVYTILNGLFLCIDSYKVSDDKEFLISQLVALYD